MTALSPFLKFSDRISVLPIIHGSGDFAIEVRRAMLSQAWDCVAVPLPPSFQEPVERAIAYLPGISAVVQEETGTVGDGDWSPERDAERHGPERVASYVPIDPCQGVITALRIALEERIPRAFIDMETADFLSLSAALPDPYALKRVRIDRFAAAVLPAIPPLPEGQPRDRAVHMASRLRELEQRFQSILFVCSIMDWPWLREAYVERHEPTADDDDVNDAEIHAADRDSLVFLLGELPFVTWLYERARQELDDDENLSIDGLKELLLATRDRYKNRFGARARQITPKLLSVYFQYVRNLSLIRRRLTPDMHTLITAAKQVAGDQFAIALAETLREYPDTGLLPFPNLKFGIGQARLPDGDVMAMKNRLPGQAISWGHFELRPPPPELDKRKWQMSWNPFSHCSWPPEDVAIEKFRTSVADAALSLIGNDLARSEKFTASLKDGLDIRETLRNWHTGDLYVKVIPPTRGNLDCVVMLFESPADPRDYPWRVTWFAEHQDESTLALFATQFGQELVGPGIALATYGGAMFLFPPRPIPDIWRDRRFDFTDTLEERILAAACAHAKERHVALLSHAPPGAGWRRLARRFGKKLVHVPLGRFSQETIQQLRMFHVLNGQHIRSYAAHFIRKA